MKAKNSAMQILLNNGRSTYECICLKKLAKLNSKMGNEIFILLQG